MANPAARLRRVLPLREARLHVAGVAPPEPDADAQTRALNVGGEDVDFKDANACKITPKTLSSTYDLDADTNID